MTEAKVSNFLLTIILILAATMLIWTIGITSYTNQKLPTTISAFNA